LKKKGRGAIQYSITGQEKVLKTPGESHNRELGDNMPLALHGKNRGKEIGKVFVRVRKKGGGKGGGVNSRSSLVSRWVTAE